MLGTLSLGFAAFRFNSIGNAFCLPCAGQKTGVGGWVGVKPDRGNGGRGERG